MEAYLRGIRGQEVPKEEQDDENISYLCCHICGSLTRIAQALILVIVFLIIIGVDFYLTGLIITKLDAIYTVLVSIDELLEAYIR
jgi:hypothetical protein